MISLIWEPATTKRNTAIKRTLICCEHLTFRQFKYITCLPIVWESSIERREAKQIYFFDLLTVVKGQAFLKDSPCKDNARECIGHIG